VHLRTLVYFSIYFVATFNLSLKSFQNYIVPLVASKWFELGIELLDETQESELDVIRVEHNTDIKKCCLFMLILWRSTHPKASWFHIFEALKSPAVSLNSVAVALEEKFSQSGTLKHASRAKNRNFKLFRDQKQGNKRTCVVSQYLWI